MEQQGKKRKRKKKSHTAAIIVITVVVLAAAATGVVLYLFRGGFKKPDRPEDIFAKYFDYAASEDYAFMHDMLSSGSKGEYPKESFIERYSNIYGGIGAEHMTAAFSSGEQRENSVVVYGNVSMDTIVGEVSFKVQMTLEADEQGHYSILWNDGLILPNLEKEDKVRVTVIEPERGSIYDRNGVLLAGRGTVDVVGLVPGKMSEDATADKGRLAELMGITVEEIDAKLAQGWVTDDTFVPVKMMAAGNKDLQDMLTKIPGVMISASNERVYTLGAAASHLTGYVQGVTAEDIENYPERNYTAASVIGKSGVELLYEEELRGNVGYDVYIEDADGRKKFVIGFKGQENGKDVYLTIDSILQQQIYKAMKDNRSASAAINPKTGEVLALVSTPTFDANDFIYGMSQQRWHELNESEAKPLMNRFRAAWCPGSSFKPMIAGIGLTSGGLDADEDLGRSGLSWQKDESWGGYYVTTLHDYQGTGLENALIYSDNIYFAKAALKIGSDSLVNGFKSLGFGEQIPFPIWMTQSQYSNSDGFDSEIQLADTGYGQGQVLVNPLHMATMYSAFVNDGSMVTPKLLKADGETPEMWKTNVFSVDAVKKINDALLQVVENPNGTGHGCYFENYTLAGKTGTAELKASQADTEAEVLGWFVAYTPNASAEEGLCIVTMIEDVGQKGESAYVVDRTRAVFEKIIGE